MKNLLKIAAILAAGLILSSCAKSGLKVYSADYPELSVLKAGELTDGQIEERSAPQTDLIPSYFVSVKDGKLFIENGSKNDGAFVSGFDNGYFAGVDLGEFDGWVKYFPYHSEYPEAGETQTVSDENCFGIIPVSRQNGYIITGKYGFVSGGSGKIIGIRYAESKWVWETLAEFEGTPKGYCYDEENALLYVLTDKNIVKIGANGVFSVVVENSLIGKIRANSIAHYKNSLYCGSDMGIYRYDPESQTEEWYPIG